MLASGVPAPTLNFFEHQQQLKRRLSEQRSEQAQYRQEIELGLAKFTREVLRVQAVHIIPPSMSDCLQQEQQLACEKLLKTKQNCKAQLTRQHHHRRLYTEQCYVLGLTGTLKKRADSDMGDIHSGAYYDDATDIIY
ncbi:hypothetical protein BDW75DRAFT_206132 [Aspergillus navahoensis]